MKLLVGLGNQGSKYSSNRHNIGFMVIDQLIATKDLPALKHFAKFKAEAALADIANTPIMLVEPSTMMNLSGEAVATIAKYYRIKPKDVWVIHDDLDLEYGKLRIRRGGGSGGHNGVASIIDALGEDFVRFRVGIGRPHSDLPTDKFVLADFTPEEAKQLPKICDEVVISLMYHIQDLEVFDHSRNLLE